MKHKHIALLSALMAMSMASCKKKTVSSPKPSGKKTEEIAKSCGLELAKPFGITDLKPVRAAELEVNEPIVMPVSSDDKVTRFVVAFDQGEISDANKLAQFGKIRITYNGKTLYEKHSGSWSEVIAIPREYNQQTLEIHVAACVSDWRIVDQACGSEKSILFSPNMNGDSTDYATASLESSRASKLAATCMKLKEPAAELLDAIGYLKAGNEDPNFNMLAYNAEQRVVIAAAGMIYNNPPALGAACATGFVEALGEKTQSLVAANTRVGSTLALAEDPSAVLGCGTAEAKKNCEAKDANHSWDGAVCIRKESVSVTIPPSEADCTAKGLKWLADAKVCGQTMAMTETECESKKLKWDEATSTCVKFEQQVTSSFSWPVSIIPEFNDKLCVTASGKEGASVALAICDKNQAEQRFKVEGVAAGYLTFKSEAATATCLTVAEDAVVAKPADASGFCTDEKQKFELYEFLQDGLKYSRITLKSDKNKCLGAKSGAIDTLAVVDCVRNFSPDALKREMFTLQPNGGGKPQKLNTNLSRPVRLASALADRCLSVAGPEADFELAATCADEPKNQINLQAGNFDNYYMVASGHKDSAGTPYCLTMQEDIDPTTKAVTRSLKHTICSSVASGQKFGLLEFSSASKKGLFALNAHGTPLCVAAATSANDKNVPTGKLELTSCGYLSDYETVKAQLFSLKIDTLAPAGDNGNYAKINKKKAWTGSIIAMGAAVVAGAIFTPALERAFVPNKSISVAIEGLAEGNAFVSADYYRNLKSANPSITRLEVVKAQGDQYKLVGFNGSARVIESPESFINPNKVLLDGSIDARPSIRQKAVGGLDEFGRVRTATTLLGIGAIIVGSLFHEGILLANAGCDGAANPFDKFVCKVRQAEGEAASIAAQ